MSSGSEALRIELACNIIAGHEQRRFFHNRNKCNALYNIQATQLHQPVVRRSTAAGNSWPGGIDGGVS